MCADKLKELAKTPKNCNSETHHAVYLRLASLRQIYDIDSVVVEVFHAAVEVLPQEGAGFTRQGDASKTQLSRKEKHKRSINTGYRHWSYIVT